MKRQISRLTMLLGVVGLFLAMGMFVFASAATADWNETDGDTPIAAPRYSHRLIVELQTPPLAVKYRELPGVRSDDGSINASSAAAQTYMQQIQAEQATAMASIQAVMPDARVSTYINEQGVQSRRPFSF